MDPRLYQVFPIIAALGFLVTGLMIALRPNANTIRGAWIAPAALAGLFLGWSSFTVSKEGLAAVWAEHVHGAWGNQIWFDLLLGVGSAFALLAPRARTVGMRPLPWFLLIAGTGCIGLLAMLSRYLFLAERSEASELGPQRGRARA